MSTLPPSAVKLFPDDSIEKKVYNLVNSLENYIPIMNDRNRLSFALLNFLKGQGDPPLISVKNNKLTLKDIKIAELAKIIEEKLAAIK
ncbi:MAG: hypothetical protein WAR79_15410 [Melioribacteraceae bacterium]